MRFLLASRTRRRSSLAATVLLGSAAIVAATSLQAPADAVRAGGIPPAPTPGQAVPVPDVNSYPYRTMPCEHAPYNVVGRCTHYDWGPVRTTTLGDRSTNSPYGYGYRNCTDFVAWALSKSNVSAARFQGLGNAKNWAITSTTRRVYWNTVPSVGAVAISKTGDFGHVAYVIAVNGSQITVAEFNKSMDGAPGIRSGTPSSLGFTAFDHFY